MELVVLALAALTTTRAEWARKEAARKAYVKRKELREAVAGVGRDKCALRSGSCGGQTRTTRPRSSGGVAGAIAVGRRAAHKRRDVGPRRVQGGEGGLGLWDRAQLDNAAGY